MKARIDYPGKTGTRLYPRLHGLDLAVDFYGQVWISPEEAANALAAFNLGNRRHRRALVDYLHRQIANGEWQYDHPQPIVFSAKRLIDGQHRLMAIAKSSVEVLAMVRTGVRDELREYIDTGINRKLEDRVAFSEDLRENRLLAMLVNLKATIKQRGHNQKPTPAEAISIFLAHQGEFIFVLDYMRRSRSPGLGLAGYMIALGEMSSIDQVKAANFAESFLSPDGEIQQARRLREYLIKQAVAGATSGGSAKLDVYQKSIGAMKAYIEDRPVLSLRGAEW